MGMQDSKTDTAWVDPADWIDPESPEQPVSSQSPIHSTHQPFELAKGEADPNVDAEFLAFLSELETDSARTDATQGSSAEPQPEPDPVSLPQERPPDNALLDNALQDRALEELSDQLSDELKDAYQLLDLPPWASLAEIKTAYRAQMQQSHPDRLPVGTPLILRASAEREFEYLQSSYRLLLSHHIKVAGSIPPSTQDPVAQPQPPTSGVPIPPEPTSVLDQLPTWLKDPRWSILPTGAVFLVGVIALVTSRPGEVEPDPDPVLSALVSTPIAVQAPDPVPTPTERIRLGQIDRFAQILQDLQPLQAQADSQLAEATTQAQRDAIEADFDRIARPIIESYGLTVADYVLIARRSQEDPELARQIVEAAQRLQRRDPAR